MANRDPLPGQSDAEIVRNAWSAGATQGAYGVEMMRRLKDAVDKQTTAIEKQAASSDALGHRIERLNVRLLQVSVVGVIVAIVGLVLTAVPVLQALKIIGDQLR